MKKISVLIKSSDPELCYELIIKKTESKVSIHCQCPAGEYGKWCKHKQAIVDCNENLLFDPKDIDSLKIAQNWIEDTEVAEIIKEINTIQDAIKKYQKDVSGLKSKLAKMVV